MNDMNLYLLTQTFADDYDTYDSCVVVAETEEEAKTIDPSKRNKPSTEEIDREVTYSASWAIKPSQVTAKFIGVAADGLERRQVICASFNAG